MKRRDFLKTLIVIPAGALALPIPAGLVGRSPSVEESATARLRHSEMVRNAMLENATGGAAWLAIYVYDPAGREIGRGRIRAEPANVGVKRFTNEELRIESDGPLTLGDAAILDESGDWMVRFQPIWNTTDVLPGQSVSISTLTISLNS